MKPFLEKTVSKFLSLLAYLLMVSIGYTCKIIFVNSGIVSKEKEKNKGVIYTFWHGRQFLLVFTHRYRNICIMTSMSKDGELQTNIINKLGYMPVRGSHRKRGAIEGTLEMIKMAEDGRDIAFAVDGPKGPVFRVKEGALFIAMKTTHTIIPISSSARKRKIFNNWDKYLLPAPFTKCVIIYGNPLTINKGDNMQEKALELENELNRITAEADKLVKED